MLQTRQVIHGPSFLIFSLRPDFFYKLIYRNFFSDLGPGVCVCGGGGGGGGGGWGGGGGGNEKIK